MPERYWVPLPRDVLTAIGPEATAFLQGQLSQDISGLQAGDMAWTWLLAPTGKVDALLRVTRRADDDWILDTDSGWGEPALARLSRFKLRTKVELATAPARVIGLRGGPWAAVSGPGTMVAAPPWPGVPGADVIVLEPGGEPPDLAGAPSVTAEQYEAERILAGIPRMGAELTEKTIPAETGLVPMTVSFDKGCYTGQELVARIDSRGGHVPRHLRGLRFSEQVAAGAELVDGDSPAGTVTSVAHSETEGWVGLGYVRRGVELPRRLRSGAATVDVVTLPL